MITVILMLYNEVTNLIAIIGFGKEHPMLSKEEADDKINEQKAKVKSLARNEN